MINYIDIITVVILVIKLILGFVAFAAAIEGTAYTIYVCFLNRTAFSQKRLDGYSSVAVFSLIALYLLDYLF